MLEVICRIFFYKNLPAANFVFTSNRPGPRSCVRRCRFPVGTLVAVSHFKHLTVRIEARPDIFSDMMSRRYMSVLQFWQINALEINSNSTILLPSFHDFSSTLVSNAFFSNSVLFTTVLLPGIKLDFLRSIFALENTIVNTQWGTAHLACYSKRK